MNTNKDLTLLNNNSDIKALSLHFWMQSVIFNVRVSQITKIKFHIFRIQDCIKEP